MLLKSLYYTITYLPAYICEPLLAYYYNVTHSVPSYWSEEERTGG